MIHTVYTAHTHTAKSSSFVTGDSVLVQVFTNTHTQCLVFPTYSVSLLSFVLDPQRPGSVLRSSIEKYSLYIYVKHYVWLIIKSRSHAFTVIFHGVKLASCHVLPGRIRHVMCIWVTEKKSLKMSTGSALFNWLPSDHHQGHSSRALSAYDTLLSCHTHTPFSNHFCLRQRLRCSSVYICVLVKMKF